MNGERWSGLEALHELMKRGGVVALTGAGLSTESGIPDYRSPSALARPRTPIQGPEFMRSPSVRRRYWARAVVGWERFRGARPNAGHFALSSLEERGLVTGVITQNVDRLHTEAGSRRVIELHGALADVLCVACGAVEGREEVQRRLLMRNPGWLQRTAESAPDGDADVVASDIETFEPVGCSRCDGVLRPKVVFFGESVPRPTVDEAMSWVDGARLLLVLGTSLAVFSGYRFLRRAAERGIAVAIVNRGSVRGEEAAVLKIDASTGEVLPALVES